MKMRERKADCLKFIGNFELGRLGDSDRRHLAECDSCRQYQAKVGEATLEKELLAPTSQNCPVPFSAIRSRIAAEMSIEAPEEGFTLLKSAGFWQTASTNLALAGLILICVRYSEVEQNPVMQGQKRLLATSIARAENLAKILPKK
jgi:predicted anti-sigma-YlaC factor YlaD